MLKRVKYFSPEILVFLCAFLTRFIRLGEPPTHFFDEVYHAFTAQQMFRGNPAAWEWWNTPPTGFAYEWTHPPLAKEFMVLSISIFGDNPFAWRFFSAFFGVGTVVLIYFITLALFKSRKIALLSSLVASLDGLILVMSRIAMNDSYFLFFSLLALFLFLKKKNLLMGIALGLAIASKWTGVFTILITLILFLIQNYKNLNHIKILELLFFWPLLLFNDFKFFKFLFSLIIIPLVIYSTSYMPFFLQKHSPPGQNLSNVETFIELQQQMYWYHTRLKATHSYESKPIDWIFNLRPVWMHVGYQGSSIASIYTLENPIITLGGILSIFFILIEFFKKINFSKLTILVFYFGFFVPWIFSPRIMFNYHYLPSTAFLTISLGVLLNYLWETKNTRIYSIVFLILAVLLFIYFYPLWTGLHTLRDFYESHFWLKSWK